jgi:hypothetical protein
VPLQASGSFNYNSTPLAYLSFRIHGRDWEISDPSPISLASAVRGPFARAPALVLALVRKGQLQLQLLLAHSRSRSHMHAGEKLACTPADAHAGCGRIARFPTAAAHLHSPALALAFAFERTGQLQLQLAHPRCSTTSAIESSLNVPLSS